MGVLESKAQRIVAFGDGDQVHVVGHKAISEQRKTVQAALLAQEIQVDEAVGVGFQDVLASVASLSDVVRGVESDDVGETSHAYRK